MRIAFLVAFFCFALTSIGQKKIKEYRRIADNRIVKYFSNSAFSKIKVDTYFAQEIDSVGLTHRYYAGDKERKISIEIIGFLYYLYSKELNYEFQFTVSVDSTGKIYFDEAVMNDIPYCIKQNRNCKYISKEKAISISRNDSIRFPDNVIARLTRLKKTGQYVWEVSGQDKTDVNYEKQSSENWPNLPKMKENTRYIDAKNGRIISYEDFTSK